LTPGARFTPPRPNLGPEPWPAPWPPSWFWLALLLAVALAALMAWRLRRSKARHPPVVPVGAEDDNPRIAHAEAVRKGLIARFGPAWGARTTEEIADDPALPGLIGPEWVGPLVDILRAADLAKFAGVPAVDEPDDDRGAWVAAFLEALKAGAQRPPSIGRRPDVTLTDSRM